MYRYGLSVPYPKYWDQRYFRFNIFIEFMSYNNSNSKSKISMTHYLLLLLILLFMCVFVVYMSVGAREARRGL